MKFWCEYWDSFDLSDFGNKLTLGRKLTFNKINKYVLFLHDLGKHRLHARLWMLGADEITENLAWKSHSKIQNTAKGSQNKPV